MRSRFSFPLLLAVAAIVLLSAALMAGLGAAKFRSTEKAFFADERTASFVRPGLVLKVTKAEIAADGTIKRG